MRADPFFPSFNIWALKAASQALINHFERPRHHHPSRASTFDTATPVHQQIRSLTLDTNVTSSPSTSSPSTAQSSPSSIPAKPNAVTNTGNANPTLDLNKPIITTHSAEQANQDEIAQTDLESEASSDSDDDGDSSISPSDSTDHTPATGIVSVRGVEPIFDGTNIISERVSTRGKIRPFEPIGEIPALDPALREHIGQVHGDGAIKKWLSKRQEWDTKYSKQLDKYRQIRRADRQLAETQGFLTRDLHGERPPLCSLAGLGSSELATEVGRSVDVVSNKTNVAVALWMKTSSKADAEHAGGEDLKDIERNVQDQIRSGNVNGHLDGAS